jgi:hypothetical protein
MFPTAAWGGRVPGHVPSGVAARAARTHLGTLRVVHRQRRTVPGHTVLAFTGAALVLALIGVVTHLPLLTVLPVGVTVLAIGGYLLLPPGDGRLVARYDHGLVATEPDGRLRAVRWDEIEGVEANAVVVGDGRITLAGLTALVDLVTHVCRELGVDDTGAAESGVAAQRRRAWITAVGLAVVALVPVGLVVFGAAGGTGVPAAAASSSGQRSVPPSIAQPGVTNSDGLQNFNVYDDVCHNVAHPDAPAYAGSGPHPLTYFYEDPNGGHNGFESSDPGASSAPWVALDMTKVQLVACVTSETGARIRDCGTYSGGTKATLARGTFYFRLYEARTARLVAGPIRLDAPDTGECPQYLEVKGHPTDVTIASHLTADHVNEALQPYAG